VTLDIMLYGASLMLEFVTLVALRIREPNLKREFKVPGGLTGAIMVGVFPFALLCLALVESERETILGMNGLVFGVMIMAAGFAGYLATKKLRGSEIKPVVLESMAGD
jgi:amino acid transporter